MNGLMAWGCGTEDSRVNTKGLFSFKSSKGSKNSISYAAEQVRDDLHIQGSVPVLCSMTVVIF